MVAPYLQASGVLCGTLLLFSVFLIVLLTSLPEDNVSFASTTVRLAAVGDLGDTSNTAQTFSRILKINPNYVVGLGDYNYETGATNVATWWANTVPDTIKTKWVGVLGNHDYNDRSAYASKFGVSDSSKFYFVKKIGSVAIVVINSELNPIDTVSADVRPTDNYQQQWINSALSGLQADSSVTTIIPVLHKDIYSYCAASYAWHSANGNILHPIFQKYSKIKLILEGHLHDYQRTKALKWSGDWNKPIVTTSATGTGHGQAYVVVGTGGESSAGFPTTCSSTTANLIVRKISSVYGFLQLDISGSTITGKYIKGSDGTILDSFTL